MFPDISCDDIFRLETPRLWLRWLRASDAPAVTAICSLPDVAQMTASIPCPYPAGEAERFILQARAATASGQALILALTLKNKARTLIGLVSGQAAERGEIEVGYLVAPQHAGRGYAGEALTSLGDAAFDLTEARALIAETRADNPASRRVLEKCGFSHVRTEVKLLPARRHAHPCDIFRRDRSDWLRGRSRRLPGMTQQPVR
jgi:RimJ/RimL family protein N-acetyltransferase